MTDNYKFVISGSDKTRAMFRSLKANLGGLRRGINSTGTKIAALAGGAGLGLLVNSTITASSETNRLANSLRMSTQALGEWQYAGKRVNLEGDKMADIFKDVSDKIGDFAVTGGGGAADMFEKLNLDINELVRLSPDQQLLKIGAALDGVQSQSEKIFFMEALAGDASRLLPLLEDNAAGLRELQQEARDFGVSLDGVDTAKMEQARQAMERVQGIGQGLANQLTIQLAPVIEEIAVRFAEAAKQGGGMGAIVQKAFDGGAKVAGVFADGVHGIGVIVKGVEVILRGFGSVGVGILEGLANVTVFLGNKIKGALLWPMEKALQLGAHFSDRYKTILAEFQDMTSGEFKVPAALQGSFDTMVTGISDAKAELHSMMMEELPSKVMAKKLDGILTAADERAQQIAAKAQAAGGLPAFAANDPRGAADEGDGKGADGLTDREREQLAARLQSLKFSWLSEMEQLKRKQADELELLQQANAEKLLTHEQYEKDLAALKGRHEQQRQELEQVSNDAQQNMLGDSFNQIIGITGRNNQKLFQMQQSVALAKAAVSLPSAVMQSFENGGGYPWGLIPAGLMTATGLAQIAQMRSASYAGAFDKGGRIPGGQFGIVGEYGPEIVRGPANVTSRKDTAAMAREAMGGGGRSVTVNQTINVPGRPDNRTASQMARETDRRQQRVQRRLGRR